MAGPINIVPPPVKKHPCPHGKIVGRIVICSRHPDETGAWPESHTIRRDGWIVTGVFCRKRCPLYPPELAAKERE